MSATPTPNGRNSGQVLAAALVAVACLGESARAHARLRTEAEQRCKRLQFEVGNLGRAAAEQERHERSLARSDRDALVAARDELVRERWALKASMQAAREARGAATAAANRAQVAEAALRRRDRDVAAMQKRVHMQLDAGRGCPSFAVQVSGTGGAVGTVRTARPPAPDVDASVRDFTRLAVTVERRRCGVLQREERAAARANACSVVRAGSASGELPTRCRARSAAARHTRRRRARHRRYHLPHPRPRRPARITKIDVSSRAV